MKVREIKTNWSYEELTAEAEANIKTVMEFALDAKKAGDIAEWQCWRDHADGMHRLWRNTVDEWEHEEDSNRLYVPIAADDPPPPSLKELSDLIKTLLAVVEDESRWDEPHMAAFHRGRIIGMCERAGIVRRSKEYEDTQDPISGR
jgi:hypothetical protein